MLVYKVCQKVKKRCAEGKKLKVKAYTKPLLEDAKWDLDILRKVFLFEESFDQELFRFESMSFKII